MIAPIILAASGIAGYFAGKNKIAKRPTFIDTYIDNVNDGSPITTNGITIWPIEGDYSKLNLTRAITMTPKEMGKSFSSYLYGMHIIPVDAWMMNDDSVLNVPVTFTINLASLNYNEKTRQHLFTLFAKTNKINYHEFRGALGLRYYVNADYDANSLTYIQQVQLCADGLIPVVTFARRILTYSANTPEMTKEKSQIQERIDKIWNQTFTTEQINQGAETWRYKNRGTFQNLEDAKKGLFKEAHRQAGNNVTQYLKYNVFAYPNLSVMVKPATSQPSTSYDSTQTQTNQ